uniref:Complement C2 n=1 Tax=Naja naja TaxID=35670 RepID=A0A8C6V9S1_NAJNA
MLKVCVCVCAGTHNAMHMCTPPAPSACAATPVLPHPPAHVHASPACTSPPHMCDRYPTICWLAGGIRIYIRCPGQMSFENGFFIPRRTFHPIGDILSFQCSDGYQLLGSSQRYCQPNGQWNGTSPVCDDGGKGNRLGDRISFQCQTNLDLIGSSQRVCMLDGEWSDTQPSCRGMHFKDTLFFQRVRLHDPQVDTFAMGNNNFFLLHISSIFRRRLILTKDSFLYVYFLLDASHSVTEPNFSIFKDAVSQIIIREMTRLTHFADHGNATGTNIHAALNAVYQMMINEERIMKDEWNKVRHAIILLTDGKSNLGGSPKIAVSHIEELVNVRNNRKDYLDIYVFGIGNLDVELSAMNEIASKKPGERHVFVMKNPQELKNAFEDLLGVPICLPCTEGASRALKKKPGTTCRDHGKHTRLLHTFNVGVISWGTYDPCAKKNKNNNGEIIRDRPSKEYKPRDFYISLFQVQDWLRKHLNNSLKFIPMQ